MKALTKPYLILSCYPPPQGFPFGDFLWGGGSAPHAPPWVGGGHHLCMIGGQTNFHQRTCENRNFFSCFAPKRVNFPTAGRGHGGITIFDGEGQWGGKLGKSSGGGGMPPPTRENPAPLQKRILRVMEGLSFPPRTTPLI